MTVEAEETVVTEETMEPVETVETVETVKTVETVETDYTEDLKKYDLLTDWLTNWKQEMLVHLKIVTNIWAKYQDKDVCIGPLIKYTVFDAFFGTLCGSLLIIASLQKSLVKN